MAEIYNDLFYQLNMGRKHIRNFCRYDSNTHGSYCPYCGYLLYYDLNKPGAMYYCNCKEWTNQKENV